MKIVLASDHAGFDRRQALAEFLRLEGHETVERGAMSTDSYDYPSAADAAVPDILAHQADFGVFVCGTGIGVSIRANRYPGIRAALCCTTESAALAREHNDANVLCIGARTMTEELSVAILSVFINTGPSREHRHLARVEKLG